jgi:hypothetical protein
LNEPRQALIDAIRSGVLPLEIALVVSNRKGAYGLERAQAAEIPTMVFPLKRALSQLMAFGQPTEIPVAYFSTTRARIFGCFALIWVIELIISFVER